MRKIEHLCVHGQYIGVANGSEAGWTFEPSKEPLLEPLQGRIFPSRQALLDAIDACYDPEIIAQMEAKAAEWQAREDAWSAQCRQDAIERTFTGAKFDEARPMKDVVKFVYGDLLAAMVAGTIPPDRYRVTRKHKWYTGEILTIWTWHLSRVKSIPSEPLVEALKGIANAYNRCEGVAYDPRNDGGCPDLWHFHVRIEPVDIYRSKRMPADHEELSYEDRCKQADAAEAQARTEAEAWGKAYLARAQHTAR